MFDPIGVIARADATLAEFDAATASGTSGDSREDLLGRLHQADAELKLTLEFYRLATPHWAKFATNFAFGVGGLVAVPASFGWSMIVTYGSAAIALNDLREVIDNNAQVRRIQERRYRIRRALVGR